MKDRPALALLKRLVRWLWSAELWLRRTFSFRWRGRYWKLAGECTACGACCLEPTIHAALPIWYLRAARLPFLAWQRSVNGFEFAAEDKRHRDLVFRCTHYDSASKRCDSHGSRPSMCRDYPSVLLEQPWPELFETCGFRVCARRPERLRAGIDATPLPPEAKAELLRKLRIE